MKITIFGLSITSAWGNGHATTYRALTRALHNRGHEVVFFEHNVEWYASNRDLREPDFCRIYIYDYWQEILPQVRRTLRESDVAIVGSYFPHGIEAASEVFSSNAVSAFYDIDTPITVAELCKGDVPYLRRDHIPEFDLYLSFTGGPMLHMLEKEFGAQRAVPLYCSFDSKDHSYPQHKKETFTCALSYMGTYAQDRQPKLEELFCAPSRALPQSKFMLAGAQYPPSIAWPKNVARTIHLSPNEHGAFYCSSNLTLNLTRVEMLRAGHSPSVRLFEAAGYGAAIVSDRWTGLETFFLPKKEILVADCTQDIINYLKGYDRAELNQIGRAAQERVLAEHQADHRAAQFENYIQLARSSGKKSARNINLAKEMVV